MEKIKTLPKRYSFDKIEGDADFDSTNALLNLINHEEKLLQ